MIFKPVTCTICNAVMAFAFGHGPGTPLWCLICLPVAEADAKERAKRYEEYRRKAYGEGSDGIAG